MPVSTQREQRQEMVGAANQPRLGPYPRGVMRACKLFDARPAAAESGPDQNMRELQQALAGADKAAMIINRDGIIEYVNSAFTALTGYPRDEAVGRTPALLRAGAHRRDACIALWKAFAVHRQFHGLVVMRRQDGALLNVDLKLWPFPDSRAAATHTVALCTDASERVAAARRVIEGEMRRATAAASASA